jgi:hypothetical protein
LDSAIKVTDIRHHAAVAAPATPEDDLAFFQALWFWVPTALLVWSAIIWAILRFV